MANQRVLALGKRLSDLVNEAERFPFSWPLWRVHYELLLALLKEALSLYPSPAAGH